MGECVELGCINVIVVLFDGEDIDLIILFDLLIVKIGMQLGEGGMDVLVCIFFIVYGEGVDMLVLQCIVDVMGGQMFDVLDVEWIDFVFVFVINNF